MPTQTDELIDHLLKVLAERGYMVDFLDYCDRQWPEENPSRHLDLKRLILHHKLAEPAGQNGEALSCHPHGFEIMQHHGGWLNYLQREAQEKRKKEEQEAVAAKSEYYQAFNGEWLYNTRWLPLIFALASLGVSIFAVWKSDQSETRMATEIEKIKARIEMTSDQAK
jgi:hypothetical protein